MLKKIILLILVLIYPIFAGYHEETRDLNLSSDGIDLLKIECTSGFLKVYGKSDLDEIQVKAEIKLEGVDEDEVAELLKRYLELTLEKHGSRAVLISYFEGSRGFFSRIRNVAINLTVYVPRKINLDINDGSGEIEIEEIEGVVEIEDGSGSITVQTIDGDIEIDDGSGELEIIDSKGRLEIDDGSGNIYIENISGDIYIDDGSGSIRVKEITGNVKVSDGSGSISISGVSEDVIIRESGSGSVSIRDVEGKIHRYDD